MRRSTRITAIHTTNTRIFHNRSFNHTYRATGQDDAQEMEGK